MASRLIIGGGTFLELVARTLTQTHPDEQVEQLEIAQHGNYDFDLSAFNLLSQDDRQYFIAFDERFGNFKRAELMQAAMERGIKLASFVHPDATLGEGVKIGANVFVGPRAVIGHGCRIDYNTVIHAGAQVGMNSRIKSSCWIESGVQLGMGVEVGSHSIIRTGAIVRDGIKVGRSCELGWAKTYGTDVRDKTVFDARYDEPIMIYGA